MESVELDQSAERRPWNLDSHDSFATAVQLLRPQTVVEPGFHAGGSWALRFPGVTGVRIGLMGLGRCWIAMDGFEPVALHQGDCFFLFGSPSYVLSSGHQGLATTVVQSADSGPHHEIRVGDPANEDTYLCGARFSIEASNSALLLDMLPPMVHIRAGDPRVESLASLGMVLRDEIAARAEGSSLVTSNLAQILLIHMLRAHALSTDGALGWLGALSDDGIGAALRAMHADVSRPWTLDTLAAIGHMSRSTFAATFKRRVGVAPLSYLIQWRMGLARNALRHGRQPISKIAIATGYQSESAFSTAFRRSVGMSPRQFRNAADPTPDHV